MKQEIQERYKNMVGATSASVVDRSVWFMTHKISEAPKFLRSLCEAPQVLQEEGFWIVIVTRRFARQEEKGVNSHLQHFIAGGDQFNLCLDTLQCDASFVKYKRYCEMTSATCKLDHYIIQCLALEFVVKELMDRVIREGEIYGIFVECLLYYLLEKYSVFYAQDVDTNRHEGIMNLMFENNTSLINNASTSHMKRHTKGIGPLEADA